MASQRSHDARRTSSCFLGRQENGTLAGRSVPNSSKVPEMLLQFPQLWIPTPVPGSFDQRLCLGVMSQRLAGEILGQAILGLLQVVISQMESHPTTRCQRMDLSEVFLAPTCQQAQREIIYLSRQP